jgi:hypothetical protein
MTYSLRGRGAPSTRNVMCMTPLTAIALVPFIVVVKLIPPCLAVADRVLRPDDA